MCREFRFLTLDVLYSFLGDRCDRNLNVSLQCRCFFAIY